MFSLGKKSNPASKSKSNEPVAGSKAKNFAQFGFLDMGFQNDGMVGEADSDDDLEAELAALTKGSQPSRGKKTRKLISEKELAALVSSSMADIPSDAEISDIDDAEVEDELGELCGEEDDPECPEIQTQAPTMNAEEIIKLLNERIEMYKVAESNASKMGDTTKARRFNRGVKSLNDMLKQTLSGKVISMEDIPPPLAESNKTLSKDVTIVDNLGVPASSKKGDSTIPVLPKPMVPVRVAPLPPSTAPPIPPRASVLHPVAEIDQQKPKECVLIQHSEDIEKALALRLELKNAALQAKRAGEPAAALQFVRLVKVCDQMVDSANQGLPVDWSCLPSVDIVGSKNSIPPNVVEKVSEKEEAVSSPVIQNDIIPLATDEAKEPQMLPTVPTIPIPQSTLEALEQRLAKYQSVMQQAQEEGNSSKARRFGRIIKQYQDAIKLHKLGKPIPFDELPDPPGYPPIPGAPRKAEETEGALAVQIQSAEGAASEYTTITPEKPSVLQLPTAGPSTVISPKASQTKTPLATRQDKQLAVLLERQSMFKTAALEAKKSGDLELAKEYLRMAKGLDPLISANKCGVPVDMETLPIPPQMKLRSSDKKGIPIKSEGSLEASFMDDFVILSSEDCMPSSTGDQNSSGIFGQLHNDLLAQLKMCTDNREHNQLIGDIANANWFDQLALHTRKDLDFIHSSAMRGDTIPRWKNEMRTFSIVKCCTDLKDDDMEVTIIRGLSYNVANPKTIDTYARFEVPIPSSDNPTKEKTKTVKHTNSPEYNETFVVTINRQSRTLLRVFKAKLIKFEVWAKSRFLRSDVLIGTASVKLADLLNHCQIHQAVDLMDGRKPVGGKLEVKIRLRNPIVGKEMEQVQEKWTVLVH
ncbi:coiled-coil and C2 domain-containing protein 1-like [Daphnia carinata]|uniref:coiled-coil and C2 domain-containing protein 1-like n=1 Tax=Daphnia carinata TaxID=120202 RepID=UPI00257970F8|nr:coiled-coil and C2 domain-containing protein 1-like [Daphnia carinata]